MDEFKSRLELNEISMIQEQPEIDRAKELINLLIVNKKLTPIEKKELKRLEEDEIW